MTPFRHPTPRDLAGALALLGPYRALTAPHVQGLEHIPDARPLLFVGNHTLFGVLDAPLLFAELYERKRIVLFSLGDHLHFQVPLWRDLLGRFGAVDGTRENCAALMRAGHAVLVFPGGGREVAKRKGEKYRLIWKERLGFVRLAATHGCTIVPFASVGVEDAFDIVLDADELLAAPLAAPFARVIDALGVRRDVLWPLVRGIGPTPLPRPERVYFGFAPPVPSAGTDPDDPEALRALRDRVRTAVEDQIVALRALREADPQRALGARLLARAKQRGR